MSGGTRPSGSESPRGAFYEGAAEMAEKVYGIDLGTTYSCLAGFDTNGRVMVFDNDLMEPTTPSVVYFSGRKAVVGTPAKEQAAATPGEVVQDIKREMGTANERMQSGKRLRPEMVSALVLRKLAQDGGIYDGRTKPAVVITCPAYFGDPERKATRTAGELAGLDVKSVINEPTAAAISYGMEQTSLDGKVVLVFDLGGGTFDATVLRIGKRIETIATGGDSMLGGRDWDKLVAGHFMKRFAEETGVDPGTLERDAVFVAEMEALAEKRKRDLSGTDKVRVSIERKGKMCHFEFTRAEFDSLTAGKLESAILGAKDGVTKAREKDSRLLREGMEVLMVGGSTLMPQVAEALRAAFGVEPKSYRPHEAVARGAAWYAKRRQAESAGALYLGGKGGDNLHLPGKSGALPPPIEDVTSKSYGVKFVHSQWDQTGFVCNLIAKNTKVPCDRSRPSSTVRDWQTGVTYDIYEDDEAMEGGELSPKEEDGVCVKIGTMELSGLTPRMAGKTTAQVYMALNPEGILHAWAIEDQTGKRCEVTIQTENAMTARDIEDAQDVVDWFKVE